MCRPIVKDMRKARRCCALWRHLRLKKKNLNKTKHTLDNQHFFIARSLSFRDFIKQSSAFLDVRQLFRIIFRKARYLTKSLCLGNWFLYKQ